MIQPDFTDGLPPDGAEGLFLACDSDGGLWLLRWDATQAGFAALGWPDAGNPEQRGAHNYAGWLIAGHQLIASNPPSPAILALPAPDA